MLAGRGDISQKLDWSVVYIFIYELLSLVQFLTVFWFQSHFQSLRQAYPGRRLLIVSNTAGALSIDPRCQLADAVEKSTGITVLPHDDKKPGCGNEIMEYFRKYPEIGVTRPDQIAIVGDRLTTDVLMANLMGSYAVWVKDGVVPVEETSFVSAFPPPEIETGRLSWECITVCKDGAEVCGNFVEARLWGAWTSKSFWKVEKTRFSSARAWAIMCNVDVWTRLIPSRMPKRSHLIILCIAQSHDHDKNTITRGNEEGLLDLVFLWQWNPS